MENLSRRKILNLIRQAVMFAPVDMGAARPNSFAVINGVSDFNGDNLGYKADDILNGDVWTREQVTMNAIELKYPMICPVLYGGTRKMEFSTKHTAETTDQIRILAADRYVDAKEAVSESEKRSVTQIMDDTEKALEKILEFLFKVRAYKVETTPNVFVEDYFNTDYLIWAEAQNKIEGYTEPSNLTMHSYAYDKFIKINQELRFDRLEYQSTKDAIIGTWLTINTLSYPCANNEFDFFLDGTLFNENRKVFMG